MSKAYILEKKGKYQHTYSDAVKTKLIEKGWKPILSVNGWNMGMSYEKNCDGGK